VVASANGTWADVNAARRLTERATPTQRGNLPYRAVEYDSGPAGMPGMEALVNEWAAGGYSFHRAVREGTCPVGAVLFLERVHFLFLVI